MKSCSFLGGMELFHIQSPLFKERICSSRSKFFPIRVDPISNSYLILRNKQEFMQVNHYVQKISREGAFI